LTENNFIKRDREYSRITKYLGIFLLRNIPSDLDCFTASVVLL